MREAMKVGDSVIAAVTIPAGLRNKRIPQGSIGRIVNKDRLRDWLCQFGDEVVALTKEEIEAIAEAGVTAP